MHMKLLHGNFAFMNPPERAAFVRELVDAAGQATDHELSAQLDGDWRSRLTAAWLIGVSRRHQFRARLGALLLESGVVFAGQGYCFALAHLGTTEDADLLTAYLDRYLRQPDLKYDQDWAMGALQHIDTALATRFTELWQQWSTTDATVHKERIDSLCALVEEC